VATADVTPTRPHVLVDEVARRLLVFYSIGQQGVYW
jgi:hypothetical protein